MGDDMSKKLYACNEATYQIFKGNDEAFINFVDTMNDQQKACFIQKFDYEDLKTSFSTYFGEENIRIESQRILFHHPLFHQISVLNLHDDYLESERISDNPLIEFLYRYAPLWAMIDEKGRLCWLGYCQSTQKRVE